MIALVLISVIMGFGVRALLQSLDAAADMQRFEAARATAALLDLRIKRELRTSSVHPDGVVLLTNAVTPTANYNRISWRPVTGYDTTTDSTIYGPTRLIFLRNDPTDPPNGLDDDRDGLIDEAQVVLQYGATAASVSVLATDVARTFRFDPFPNGDDIPLNLPGVVDFEVRVSFEILYVDRRRDVRSLPVTSVIAFRNGRKT